MSEHSPTSKASERPLYKLVLRPERGVDAERALRRLLKIALRTFGLKCISVEPGAAAMSANVVRFPARSVAAIFVMAAEDGWLVLAPRGHGWLHGDLRAALRDARWLSWNLGLPVREVLT
jgi:hypothetical protein